MSIDTTSETAIFERIVLPGAPTLSQESARSLLALQFSPKDREQMEALAEKARQGSLTEEEQQAIENYERVGHYLAILQSKARMALDTQAESAS